MAHLPLFAGLSAYQIEQIKEDLHVKAVPTSNTLLTLGESGDGIFILLQGAAKVCIGHRESKDVIVTIYGPGDLIGWAYAVDTGIPLTVRQLHR